MTPLELAQQALADDQKATPGPWRVGEDKRENAASLCAQPVNATTGKPQGPEESVIIPFGRAHSDAAFIAAARSREPLLAAEVVRLTADVAASERDFDAVCVERDALKAENDRLTKELREIQWRMEGLEK